jgi:hypothetical protein
MPVRCLSILLVVMLQVDVYTSTLMMFDHLRRNASKAPMLASACCLQRALPGPACMRQATSWLRGGFIGHKALYKDVAYVACQANGLDARCDIAVVQSWEPYHQGKVYGRRMSKAILHSACTCVQRMACRRICIVVSLVARCAGEVDIVVLSVIHSRAACAQHGSEVTLATFTCTVAAQCSPRSISYGPQYCTIRGSVGLKWAFAAWLLPHLVMRRRAILHADTTQHF